MALPVRPAIAIVLVSAAAAVPATAGAVPSMLFSQAAGTATSRPVGGSVADVTLRTRHRAVLAFEDRPGRRTATLAEHKFVGLWRGAFRTDSPNAVLTGRDAQGRNRRVVAVITRAARTADGVRYRMRALRGSVPASLTQANLLVDDVPLSAILAFRAYVNSGPVQYEPIINAVTFPQTVTVQAGSTLTVPPGTTATFGTPGGQPATLDFGTVNVAPGATLVLNGLVLLNAQNLSLAPGSRIVMPQSPNMVMLQLQGPSTCAPPAAFTWTATVTPPQPWPGPAISSSATGGICSVVWNFPTVPAGMSTQQVIEVSGAGFSASPVILSVHSR